MSPFTPSDLGRPLASLSDPLPIPTIARPFDVTIRPPGSKSITNRALLLAALADGTSTLRGALTEADDARVMIRALEQLGARIETAPIASRGAAAADTTLRITGVNGRWKIPPGQTVSLDLHNAGTATRFLTAAALLAPPDTTIIIDGDARMRERPIRELVDALNVLTNAIGGSVEYADRSGFPPLHIRGAHRAAAPAIISFGRTQSSQFISALLMLAPLLPGGLSVRFTDAITSEPYIDMTAALLSRVRIRISDDRPAAIRIESQPLIAFDLDIEPDAIGATYFEAAAALLPRSHVTIDGLDLGPRGSLQGDTHFARILTAMGASVERASVSGRPSLRTTGPAQLRPIDADLSDMPDTAMTAAVLCCFAEPTAANPTATSTLRGLRTLRVKETDRLEALRTELAKLGARIEIFADGNDEALRITPPPRSSLAAFGAAPLTFDTYKDHRMAMSLALIGLRVPGVRIRDPGCVGKTYPGFWGDLRQLFDR